MQKNPDTKSKEVKLPTHKGKRKKAPTQCVDARRMRRHCGICGSENLVEEGVVHCTKCGKEKTYLVESPRWWIHDRGQIPKVCKCVIKKPNWRGKMIEHNPRERYFVKACADCGAVKGPICPNCKKPMWSIPCEKRCKNCGFTKKG